MPSRFRVHAWYLFDDTLMEREWGGFQTAMQVWKNTPAKAKYIILEDEHGQIYLAEMGRTMHDADANVYFDLSTKCASVEAARMAARLK